MKKCTFHQNVSVSELDYDSTSAPQLSAALRLSLDKRTYLLFHLSYLISRFLTVPEKRRMVMLGRWQGKEKS